MKMQHNYVLDSLSSKKNITTPPPHTTLYIVMYMHIAQVKWRELNERVPIDLCSLGLVYVTIETFIFLISFICSNTFKF